MFYFLYYFSQILGINFYSLSYYFSNFSIVRKVSHRCHHCYIPALALQVAILLYQAEG